ncbi:hypothetical protein ABZ352_18950 [Streptomyces griseofuscus]|uniref:hypothetical protein n=1 Tax=Streptomyces griseofuscus TaxID=146922 RepID=UPI0033FA06A0
MPTSKPRKSRKRTREIKERSRTTGASHTKAMRANDAERGQTWPPSGTPKSPHAYGGDFERNAIPVLLLADVPSDAPDSEVAQVVADACDLLVRAGEGWYRAMADVWAIPARRPSLSLPGHSLATMLFSPSARRPWWLADGEGNREEVQAFMDDALTAVEAALHRRYPTTSGVKPELLPVGHDKARDIIEKAGEDARFVTTDPHTSVLENDGPEPEPEGPPYRVVDRENRGWHTVGEGEYMIDFGGLRPGRPETAVTFEVLEAEHGPLRRVVSPDPGDVLMLRGALTDAGKKAAASTLVALYRIATVFAHDSSPGTIDAGSLIAGREGSWESDLMMRLAWTIGGDLHDKPSRYDEEIVGQIINVLEQWTRNPKRYVEVAENLADIFGEVVDERGGWAEVADRYLQPGARVGHPEDTIEAVRNFLFTKSRSFWDEQRAPQRGADSEGEGNE